MLNRVATRSLRHYAKPALVQPVLPQSFSRTFAKQNKHKRSNEYKLPLNGPQTNKNRPGAESLPEPVSNEVRDLPTTPNSTIKLPSNTSYSPSQQQGAEQGTGIKPSFVSSVRNEATAQPVVGLRSSSSTDDAKPLNAPPQFDVTSAPPISFSSAKENSKMESDPLPPLPDLTRGIPSTLDSEIAEASSGFRPNAAGLSEPPPKSDATSAPPSSFSSAIEDSETKSDPLPPLPDLTRGIPSTLDSEIADASSGSRPNATGLDITEDPSKPSAGSRRGADLPNSAYISSLERRRNRVANIMYASILGLSVFGTLYLGRNWDTEDEEIKHPDAPSGWGLGLFYNRAHARLRDLLDYYNEPAFPKLLPKPDPMMERPYTLVLSLEDLLIHSEWTREHGWRSAKRPGVDYFLRYLSQYYELVVFTSVASMNAEPIIRKLDPFRIITWPLFREATRFKDGTYIKDLSYLNRDLSKVILIDTVPDHAKLQPENAIILPKWKGTLPDNGLVSMIPFLEYVATMGFNDTREVLKSLQGTHIPTEFAKRESVARERFQKQLAEEKSKRPRRSGFGMLGNALGIKHMGGGLDGMEQTLSEGFEQGKTYQDQVRERGQRQYEILEKEIQENGEKWLKEMAEDEEKIIKESAKGAKLTFMSFFGVGSGEK